MEALLAVRRQDLIETPEQILRLLDCRLTLADPQCERVALSVARDLSCVCSS
jgi:hypothetical protein